MLSSNVISCVSFIPVVEALPRVGTNSLVVEPISISTVVKASSVNTPEVIYVSVFPAAVTDSTFSMKVPLVVTSPVVERSVFPATVTDSVFSVVKPIFVSAPVV